MELSPIDPNEVSQAASQIVAEFGMQAEMEVMNRIVKADSEGDSGKTAFWQEVSRFLQSSSQRLRPFAW
jgi:hypothetical protein